MSPEEYFGMPDESVLDDSLTYEDRQHYDGLRQFFDLSSDFMWVLDSQGCILAVNSTVIRRLGYSNEELRGKSVLLVHPAHVRDETAEIVRQMLEGTRDMCPMPLEAKDGTLIPVETRIATGGSWEGQAAVFGMSRDLSAMAYSEEKLSQLFRFSRSLVSVWDEKTGVLVDVNERLLEVSGYAREELAGISYEAMGHLVDFDDARSLANAAANGLISTVETGLTTRDGSRIYGVLTAFRVEVHGDGLLVAEFQDQTALTRAERALRDSEERLERALAGADLGSWDWNLQTDEVVYDERWFRMLGFGANELDGIVDVWRERVHPDDHAMVMEALERHFSGETAEYETTHRLRKKDGSWLWVLDRGKVMHWDEAGKPMFMSGTQMDVTERQEAQYEIEKRDRLLGGLASALGHLVVVAPALSADDIGRALEELGRAADADRAYIFENIAGDPGTRGYCSQRYEWSCDAVEPQIDNPDLQMVPWDMMASRWYDTFLDGGHIAGDVKDFPADERAGLEPQDIISLLALPIYNDGALWGFIGFDAVKASRIWADTEVSLLQAAAAAFGAAIERKRLAAQLVDSAEHNRELALRVVDESRLRLEKMVADVAEAMGRVVEVRDPYTRGHQQRTEEIAAKIAIEMGLDDATIEAVRMAAFIHDVGKLAVPVEILTKTGPLSEVEFALIREHPKAGYEILKGIDFPWPIAEIVLQHHERCDGSGYPRGLTCDEILPAARIISVADMIEAISSDRPYRPRHGVDYAIEVLKECAPSYDSKVVEAALALHARGEFEQI